MPDGTEVAVRRLPLNSRQGKREFAMGVKNMMEAHHRNVVRLIGCCYTTARLLIYEHLPNGNLAQILFGTLTTCFCQPNSLRQQICHLASWFRVALNNFCICTRPEAAVRMASQVRHIAGRGKRSCVLARRARLHFRTWGHQSWKHHARQDHEAQDRRLGSRCALPQRPRRSQAPEHGVGVSAPNPWLCHRATSP